MAVGTALYAAPSDATCLLRFDVQTWNNNEAWSVGCVSTETMYSGSEKWDGITAVGTTVYAAPYQATCLLQFNVGSNTLLPIHLSCESTQAAEYQVPYKWRGITAVGTRLYAAPYNARCMLTYEITEVNRSGVRCIDTEGQHSGLVNGVEKEETFKWAGITTVGTAVYAAPYNAPCLLFHDNTWDEELRFNPSMTLACMNTNHKRAGRYKWVGIAPVGFGITATVHTAPYDAPCLLRTLALPTPAPSSSAPSPAPTPSPSVAPTLTPTIQPFVGRRFSSLKLL